MITLGINAAYHDSSAAIVVDGRIVAACEEERFTRIKHAKRPVPFSAWELPFNAIGHCLAACGATMEDVDHVAYSFDPGLFLGPDYAGASGFSLPWQPSADAPVDDAVLDASWRGPWDPVFAAYVINAPRLLRDAVPLHLQRRFGPPGMPAGWRWHFVNHHLAHQASAFLCAPFSRCAVMTLDGRGERATTSYGAWRDGAYEHLGQVDVPHSLGILYERVTQHLGFLPSSDEFKVMALAAFGTARFRQHFDDMLRVGDDGRFRIESYELASWAGPPRERGMPLEQAHLDLAASLQSALEDAVLELARWLHAATGEPCLAMAGGVALNCLMNARLRDEGPFEQVWVQPAAGDAGTSLGAALWVDALQRQDDAPAAPTATTAVPAAMPLPLLQPLAPRLHPMRDAFLGPAYGDDEIEALLKWARLPYRRLAGDAARAEAAARLLADNRVIGWFQGRMEFGPRALGARSILASPIEANMQARLNEYKDREDFRPVAPAVLEEAMPQWFEATRDNGGSSPFMLFTYRVRPDKAQRIPACCHVDHTARIQTVDAVANPPFHALLKAFEALTGVPVLINTSFNVRSEPIVCTPKDAIDAFHSTPLDALFIESFLLEKDR